MCVGQEKEFHAMNTQHISLKNRTETFVESVFV